jgi:hypothetical protein
VIELSETLVVNVWLPHQWVGPTHPNSSRVISIFLVLRSSLIMILRCQFWVIRNESQLFWNKVNLRSTTPAQQVVQLAIRLSPYKLL